MITAGRGCLPSPPSQEAQMVYKELCRTEEGVVGKLPGNLNLRQPLTGLATPPVTGRPWIRNHNFLVRIHVPLNRFSFVI